jgi:hypothetical protein
MTGYGPRLSVLVALGLIGCPGPEDVDLCLPLIEVSADLVAPDHIAAVAVDEGVRVRGLRGAARPGVDLTLDGATVDIDEGGGFDITLDGSADTVDLSATRGDATETVTYRVRSLDAARACVAGAAIPTGTLPNDVAAAPACGADGAIAALVTLTGDSSVDVVDLASTERPERTPFFPPTDGVLAAEPFGIARTPSSDHVAVTLRGLGTVALVDACTGDVLDSSPPQTADSGWLVVDVDPPVTLREPRDVDGDGLTDTQVRRMRASGPQAVVFSGGRLWVAYTNVLEPALDDARPMTAGDGALLVFDLDGDVLVPSGHRVLPVKNPQGLTPDGAGGVWVAATGVYAYDGPRLTTGSPGALVRVTSSLAVEQTIDAGGFAPGTPTLTGDRLVVGSTLEGVIAVVDVTAPDLDDATRWSLTGDDRLNTVFDTVALPGGLVGALHFETDRLHVIDPRTETLDAWPFSSPITIGDGGQTFRGAIALDVDGWRGAALLALSAEIVPLDLRQVMGP